jgi:hypothetical protein
MLAAVVEGAEEQHSEEVAKEAVVLAVEEETT